MTMFQQKKMSRTEIIVNSIFAPIFLIGGGWLGIILIKNFIAENFLIMLGGIAVIFFGIWFAWLMIRGIFSKEVVSINDEWIEIGSKPNIHTNKIYWRDIDQAKLFKQKGRLGILQLSTQSGRVEFVPEKFDHFEDLMKMVTIYLEKNGKNLNINTY